MSARLRIGELTGIPRLDDEIAAPPAPRPEGEPTRFAVVPFDPAKHTVCVLTDGVICDSDGKVVANLNQQGLVAFRMDMELARSIAEAVAQYDASQEVSA